VTTATGFTSTTLRLLAATSALLDAMGVIFIIDLDWVSPVNRGKFPVDLIGYLCLYSKSNSI
jgi:uncharacterized membrane protein